MTWANHALANGRIARLLLSPRLAAVVAERGSFGCIMRVSS
jgi:hypothetical protein